MAKDDSLFYGAAAVGLVLAGIAGVSYLKSNTCGKCGRLGKHDHEEGEKPKEEGCGCNAGK